jgi:uncharacterized protein (DUF2147 family)
MFHRLGFVVAAFVLAAGTAYADPIVGNWRTESGERAQISGSGTYSIVIKTGKNAGKNIGRLKGNGKGSYSGTIRDPNENKSYSGKARVSGGSLVLSGCVLGGLICKSQTWSRM